MNNILASAIVKLLTCYNRFKLISLFSVFFSFLFNLPVPEFHFFSLSLSTFPFLNLSLSLFHPITFLFSLLYVFHPITFSSFLFPSLTFLNLSLSVCCAFHFSVSLSSIANFVSDQDDPDPIYLSTGSKNRIPKGD
jgi:hypothetical protein